MGWVEWFNAPLYIVSPPSPRCSLRSMVVYGGGWWWGLHTPRSSRPSSLWRGMTVTSSISHKNAISGGVKPGGRGNAIMLRRVLELCPKFGLICPRCACLDSASVFRVQFTVWPLRCDIITFLQHPRSFHRVSCQRF